MLTKKEAGEAVRAARARLGVTWAQLAEAVGRPAAWTTSALLGQQPMTTAQARAAGSLLELGEDVTQALQLQPTRGALESAVPAECDDWAHLDGRGDLNSGVARQPYSIALSCHIVQNLVGLGACVVGPQLEEVCALRL